MKAMVLAAGLGTRLRPLTNERPKALVELGGRTLLEITLTRLKKFGVREAIVNVHHFADQVVDYLAARNNFGMHIEISREDEQLLDTGGGLKKAAWFFGGNSEEPFLLHNVDVVSTIDLRQMIVEHRASEALATLAIQRRPGSRQLLFNADNLLSGRRKGDAEPELVRDAGPVEPYGFCGIHVISPRLLAMISQQGAFSIIDTYLELSRVGKKIVGYRADGCYWRDVGTAENLRAAEADAEEGRF